MTMTGTDTIALYKRGDRVKVIDPADRRKRLHATVLEVNEGRGPLEYRVIVDDETLTWSVEDEEITGRSNVPDPRERTW